MPNLKIQKHRFFIDFLLYFDYIFDFLIKIRFVSQSAICIVPRNKKRHKHKHRSRESSILFFSFLPSYEPRHALPKQTFDRIRS